MSEHSLLPWRVSDKIAKLGHDTYITIVSPYRWVAHILENCDQSDEDAAFIVKAVNNHDALVEEVRLLRLELHEIERACAMQANIMRDQKRTKAYGEVAKMCERVADAFARTSAKAHAALKAVQS